MRWLNTVLLAAAASIMVLRQSVDAIDRLCINADNVITKLYIDGKDYTGKLPFRGNVNKCDCVQIPVNSGVIAVEAKNLKGSAGIQSCNTAGPELYREWLCRPVKRARSNNWYQPNFDDSKWKPAKTYKCQKHCRQYYKQPCAISSTKCFWSHEFVIDVRCRLKQCADGCTGCRQAGFGSCDADKCKLGSGVNALTTKTFCNRRCRLEVKAWGQTGEAADGYIRVTDLLTNGVDEWKANVGGDYLATIDMSNCSVTNRNYALWSNTGSITVIYNTWKSSGQGANFQNVIGVELGVGPNDPAVIGPFGSTAPWISVYKLGLDETEALYGDNHNRTFSAVLKGVQNGVVTFSDAQLKP